MSENKNLLPHHVQQNLCTTRLPYRQGRKLTAVKVYTIAKESNHLLVFGVPSLNLRQETKSLFMKFGKLLQFTISPDHTVEPFTETFHAQYERIQSARVAKKMLDTKNFYGGLLHVCYAPEFETINETKQKLVQRQKDVVNRLRNLEMEKNSKAKEQCFTQNTDCEVIETINSKKLNMGEINTFNINNESMIHKKRKTKPNLVESENNATTKKAKIENRQIITSAEPCEEIKCTEIVDFTSVDKEVVTNINESLNYNKFGNEVIRKIEQRPLNKVTINLNKKLV